MKTPTALFLLALAFLATAPAQACRPFGSYVFVEDAKGGIWFTEGDNNAIGRLDPDGTVRSYPVPTPAAEPSWLALDGRGNVWFVEADAGRIGRLGPDGRMTEFPPLDGHPISVAVDGRGNAWFTQMAGRQMALDDLAGHRHHPTVSKVGRIAPDGGQADYPIKHGWPTSLAFDRAGRTWISILVPGDEGDRPVPPVGKLARLDDRGRWTEVRRWRGSCPNNLTLAPDGDLIYTDHCRGVLGRLGADGRTRETALPANAGIQQLSRAADGSLWFTTTEHGRLGRILPDGKIEFVPRPDNGDDAFALLVTRSGDVVYSEFYNYNINRLRPGGELVEHLVNIEERHDQREVREGEACYLKFAAGIADKRAMDRKRAEEVRLGRFKPVADGSDRLATERCLGCHDARRLLLSRRSDWTPSIERMREYMALNKVPPLSAEERLTLVRYFNEHYGLGR
ncbi:MAG: hypothetical protein HGA75_16190 [Thiobacillus sp.]|nr:hypothetical protein [Thiobacillus sp.]